MFAKDLWEKTSIDEKIFNFKYLSNNISNQWIHTQAPLNIYSHMRNYSQ